jgi:hypothetical protein
MKNIFLFCSLILSAITTFAQSPSPVKWSFESREIGGDKIEITATATIPPKWCTYSQMTSDEGPIPTEFVIGDDVIKFEEKSKSSKEMDPIFEVEVIKFKDKAIFTHQTTKSNVGKMLYTTYMCCDDIRCLPPVTLEYIIKTSN